MITGVGIYDVFCIRRDIDSLIDTTGTFGPMPKRELEVVWTTKSKHLRHGGSEVSTRQAQWTLDGVLATNKYSRGALGEGQKTSDQVFRFSSGKKPMACLNTS